MLTNNQIAIFRVEQTATLKMIKTLVSRELRAAPGKQTIRTPSPTTSEQVTSTISDRPSQPHHSQLHPPHPTIATSSEPATSTASDHRNHVRAIYIHRIRPSQPRPYSSPAIFGINVMSAGSQATESSWSAESQRAASCSRR